MQNYAEKLKTLPHYGPRVIIGGTSFIFYKSIHGVNFYQDKDYFVFELKHDKGVYIVVGKVGVSDDEEIYNNFHEAIHSLEMEKDLQGELSLFDDN